MKNLVDKIPEDYRDISVLVLGNSFALLVPIIISPILSRIYSASAFGLLTIYLSIISILNSFSTGRYDYAILKASTKKNAVHLFKLSFLIVCFVATILSIAIYFWGSLFLNYFDAQEMGNAIYLIPISLFLFSMIVASHNALNREKAYKAISTSKVIRTFFSGGGQIAMYLFGVNIVGLIIGKFIGDLFTAGYLITKVNRFTEFISSRFSVKRARCLAEKYVDFPKVNSIHAFVNTVSISSVPLILGYFFSENIVGYYGLSFMVCIVPVQLLATAFYQVFSKKIADINNSGGTFHGYSKRTLKQLSLLSIIPFGVLMIFGKGIFTFIFGEEWVVAGEFVQFLSPYLYLVFVITPFTYIPMIFNEQKKAFYFELLLSFSRIFALVIGAITSGVYLAVMLFSATSFVVQTLNLVWIFSLTKRRA